MANEGALEQVAWMVASSLEGVVRGQPFGPGYDVSTVVGKVFMLITEVPGRLVVTVKCEPEYATALRAEFPTITPGYHMNKRHWISIANGTGITADLVTELVTNAYLLVVDTLPQRLRPPRPDPPEPRSL